MKRNVTLKDVAALAGVSFKTVSNVVNHRDDQMTAQTRERVLKAIDELGYRTNHSARSLKLGRTGVIGLAVPGFAQPFFGYLTDEAAVAAQEHGLELIVSVYEHLDHGLDTFVRKAPQLGADGWIIFNDQPLPPAASLFHQSFPIVVSGNRSVHGLLDLMSTPNTQGSRLGTEWLIDGGNDVVAFIGAPKPLFDIADERERERTVLDATDESSILHLKGYIQALHARGRTVDWRYVMPCSTISTPPGERAARRLLERCRDLGLPVPGGILCANDAVAYGVISAVSQAGLSIPDDVEIIGFDNLPGSQYVVPPLSTIDQHVDRYVSKAIDRLLARIDGDAGEPRTYTLDADLIERGTTRKRG
ncbi:LacI family transcriptional regulator [Bifidobacterium amazonense]|uniref:LacI family transcriptional regulator n=1 Tax=Bifidobacterium amazonense TaxID=2809027 RepID=A0ABS9VUI8_9BIFI|nr:LacI family DNA-binding transcriptional regulator [Bifidobacterium amazonense]MCH9275591.1 LacI family transcriptional regulator [Bifidobacterium amazonense]